jgi:hypothetical protein
VVVVEVPADLMPNQQARNSITAKRKPADFERDFLHLEKDGTTGMIAVLDGDILNRGFPSGRRGRCPLRSGFRGPRSIRLLSPAR